MTFDSLNGKQIVAIVGNQFGDEGKGKFVDIFAEWANVIVRGTGGANAGHTIRLPDRRYALHLIPSGILYDGEGRVNVIGSGVAFDPVVARRELQELAAAGISTSKLRIAYNAKLVLPQHLVMDRVGDGLGAAKRIGTTGRGIGPVYCDHYDRIGLITNDLLNPILFRRKLERNLEKKVVLLQQLERDVVEAVMATVMDNGEPLKQFYCPDRIFDIDAMTDYFERVGQELREYLCDADAFVRDAAAQGRRILLEGSQALLLSVDFGTYPYVTSTDCSVHGLATGAGLRQGDIELTLGVTKAFYMSRVGGGPFPTEIGGTKSAEWCSRADLTQISEVERFPDVTVNHEDAFHQGMAIRRAGAEYGTTTGRPRRVGWLDLPLLRFASRIHGSQVILSKVDVLNACESIKICTGYRYQGPDFVLGQSQLSSATSYDVAEPRDEVLRHCQPVYEELPGWQCELTDCAEYRDLPEQLRACIDFVEQRANVKVVMVSTGPERKQTITKG